VNLMKDASAASLQSVEVILVVTTEADPLASCLALLPAAGEGVNLSVTVVDNCSSEDIRAALRGARVSANVLRTSAVLGFGGANNVGIQHAMQKNPPPDALLVLNPDVELPPGSIRILCGVLKDMGCGAVSPVTGDKLGGNLEAPLRTLWGRRLPPVHGRGWQLMEVDRLPGCCMLISSESLRKIGLFDEQYFLYWEEIDLCIRLRMANYDLLIAREVSAIHLGAGQGRLKLHRAYYMWRNQIYFAMKNYGPLLGSLFLARRLLISNVREVFTYLRRGRAELILAGLAGLCAGFCGEVGHSTSRFAVLSSPYRQS